MNGEQTDQVQQQEELQPVNDQLQTGAGQPHSKNNIPSFPDSQLDFQRQPRQQSPQDIPQGLTLTPDSDNTVPPSNPNLNPPAWTTFVPNPESTTAVNPIPKPYISSMANTVVPPAFTQPATGASGPVDGPVDANGILMKNPQIRFNINSEASDNYRVFPNFDADNILTFGLTVHESVHFLSVSLFADQAISSDQSQVYETIISKDHLTNTTVFASLDHNQVQLNLTGFQTGGPLQYLLQQYLTVSINWTEPAANPAKDGVTTSPYFSIFDFIAPDQTALESLRNNIAGGGSEVLFGKEIVSAAPVPAKSQDSSSSPPPLTRGALAGVIIAGIMFVIIIVGFSTWLFIRRRRRRQTKSSSPIPYQKDAHGSSTNDAFTGGGGGTVNNLHKNTGSRSISTQFSGHHHHALNHHHSHSQNNSPIERRSTDPRSMVDVQNNNNSSSTLHTQPPQSQRLSRTIAHLVEEGMTEDDIRRLEEEERQLDAEIERAARR